MPIKLPSFFRSSRPTVMSHREFETLVVNMGKQATMAEKARANGDVNAGKQGYFKSHKNSVQMGSDVISGEAKDAIGKASTKQNQKAIKRITAYLNAYQKKSVQRCPADPPVKKSEYEPRYDATKVYLALTSLRKIKGQKNFDLVPPAKTLEGLLPEADRKYQKVLAGRTYGATKAVAEAIEALRKNPAEQANADATPNQRAKADAAFQPACRQARARGRKFEAACGQLPKGGNGTRLIEWIDSKFLNHSVTAGFTVSTLNEQLNRAYEEAITAQGQLQVLLSEWEANEQAAVEQSPALCQSISQQSDWLMQKMSLYLQKTAKAGALLSCTPYFATDPALRTPLQQWARAVAKQGEACIHRDSAFMYTYQWAHRNKSMVDARLLALQAPERAVTVGPSDALLNLSIAAKDAYQDFDQKALGLSPQQSTAASQPSAAQMDLRAWMQDLLVRNGVTAYLPVSKVKSTLFDSLPKRIDELEGKLRDTVEQCNGSGVVTPVQKSLLLALCAELDQAIDAYIGQLAGVSAVLMTLHPEDNTPESGDVVSLRRLREKAGRLMQNLAFAHQDPQGHLMGFKAYVQRVRDELNRPVAEDQTLAREPARRRRGFVEAPPTPARSTVAKMVRSKSVGAQSEQPLGELPLSEQSVEFKADLSLVTTPIHTPRREKEVADQSIDDAFELMNAELERTNQFLDGRDGAYPLEDAENKAVGPLQETAAAKPLSPQSRRADAESAIKEALRVAEDQLFQLGKKLPLASGKRTLVQAQVIKVLTAQLAGDPDTIGIDPEYMTNTLAGLPSSVKARYEELRKLGEGHNSPGNSAPRDKKMLKLSQTLEEDIRLYVARLKKVGQLLSNLGAAKSAGQELSDIFSNTGRSLFELALAEENADSPLMAMRVDIQALGQTAQQRLDEQERSSEQQRLLNERRLKGGGFDQTAPRTF